MASSRVRIAAVAIVALLLLAACGGAKTSGTSGLPTLVGTAIPTVSPIPPTAAVCTPPEGLTLPGNFPGDIQVPPDFTVFSVKTTPYLQVIGRSSPPFDPNRLEAPHGIAAFAIVSQFRDKGWTAKYNDKADGEDYDLTNPDGRVVHFNSLPRPDCSGVVQLTFDLKWITP